ncbi:Alpha/Beta hydrolase protein [Xylariaceae sp. FL0594]|nr:Alpha/Beta hydrolase protein [Xylariaceae sp. FL0594]
MHFPSLALLAGSALLASAASLQQVTEAFGPNPRNVGFYIYVPDQLAARPPILVNPHWCHGDARACYAGSQYAALASRHGFIVIYPDSPNGADKCWDVSSDATLAHGAGGDSLGIVSMVRWALDRYGGDPARVFVTGVSSGAMMTSTLVGAYPDVFAAGSAFSGVPFGCFAGDGYAVWSGACATGQISHTPAEWAAIVRAAYPAYENATTTTTTTRKWRPKMQIFHGTNDEVLNYNVFKEEVKQWTAVFGYDGQHPTVTTPDTPVANWTKYVYGPSDWFEAYSAGGVTHNIQNQEATVMDWFDLACTSGDCFRWGKGGP